MGEASFLSRKEMEVEACKDSKFSVMRYLSAGLRQKEKHLHITIGIYVKVNDWVETKLKMLLYEQINIS